MRGYVMVITWAGLATTIAVETAVVLSYLVSAQGLMIAAEARDSGSSNDVV